MLKILNILRKIFKSLGKKEKKIINLITFINNLKNTKKLPDTFNEKLIKKNKLFFKNKNLWPKKIAACIIFSFNSKRLIFLSRICKSIEKINSNTDITIVVNKEAYLKKNLIKSIIKKKTKIKINFFYPKNLLDPRLLTYSHFEVFKKKINHKKYSHFLYLEDDIQINQKNIKYWMIARNLLKNKKLIPVFLRTEINFKDKKEYLVDSTKKNLFFFQSKIIENSKKIAFVNLFNFFTPAYFYDRELMLEHLKGPSSSIDFGHGSFNSNYINPNMIELGVMERAATLLAHKDVPSGFFHRNVVPVDIKSKLIKNYCLIKHLSNRFTNEKKGNFGRIQVNKIFF